MKYFGNFYLNCFVRMEEFDWKADNGIIHPIDWVLTPPPTVIKQIFNLPMVASTFTSAVQVCKLAKELCEEKGITCFVPTQEAWMQLNYSDLIYLFSPLGREDLKKIIEYHIVSKLVYTTKMMEKTEKEITLPTLLKKDEITVYVTERNQKRGSRNYSMEKESPDCYLFVLNNGEANIVKSDIVCKNGVFHLINNVLIPSSVQLPSQKEMMMRGSVERRL